MRKLLVILLILSFHAVYSCDCNLASIERSYKYSSAIFYGKYLNSDTAESFHNIFGMPFIVDNFEIVKFYRGIDTSMFNYIKAKNTPYIISLIRSCKGPCGMCFERDKMYLVYAYRDFYSGHLTTDGCTRTREIINNNFISTASLDPDIGKDEIQELDKVIMNDTAKKDMTEYFDDFTLQKDLLKTQLEESQHAVLNRTWIVYMITTISLVIISFLGCKLRKQSKHS